MRMWVKEKMALSRGELEREELELHFEALSAEEEEVGDGAP